jgi:hypothetical protein
MGMSPRLLRPKATGFSPKQIANLAFWLDGADYNASTGAWNDKSGNARNFSQSVANDRPTKTLTINGRDVVSFDGTNDYVAGPQVNFTQWSAFVLVRPDRTTGTNGILTADPSIGTRGPQFVRWDGTTYQSIGFQATNSVRAESSSVSAAAGTVRIVCVVQTASALEMWTDNTSNGSTACVQQAFTNEMAIGAASYNTTPSATSFMKGDIGEIMLYSRGLATAERETIQRYLGKRWGINL